MPPLARQYRGLDQLSCDPVFIDRVSAEFPTLAAAPDRRSMLKLMAAGLALAGVSGCDDGAPGGDLIPPVLPPKNAVSAGSNMFATASMRNGYGDGILVRHANGRPIKVEGNPRHPSSLGGTCPIGQAAILDFYNPDRSRNILRGGLPQPLSVLQTELAGRRSALAAAKGEGFRLLTGTITSPTMARQITALRTTYPAMRWHRWEPVSRDNIRAAAQRAYGQIVDIVPKLDAADLIVAIDSDLLDSAPGHLRFARDFAARRNPARTDRISRLYAIEPTPSLTGVAADQRFIVGQGDMPRIVAGLAYAVLRGEHPGEAPPWVGMVANDIRAARGRVFVHAGPYQPAELHVLVHAMNEALGGRGATYTVTDPVEVDPIDNATSLRELMADMQAGRVTDLLIIDSDPVFTAPGFAAPLGHVAFSLTLTVEPNATSRQTRWALPRRHAFEDWSDVRGHDGTVTIMQPQAQPLFGGISPHTILGLFAGPSEPLPETAVRATSSLSDRQWHDALASGIVPDTSAAISNAALRADAAAMRIPSAATTSISLLIRPDPHLWDGRHANNAWLQELPRPLTKLTWGNPLLVSPDIARRLQLVNGDRASLACDGITIDLPVWLMPGQAPDTVVGLLGWGKSEGSVAQGVGTDLYPLTTTRGTVSLTRSHGWEALASTEHHDPIFADAGDYVRHETLAAFKANPHVLGNPGNLPHLYERRPPGPAAWGMSIDLNACIGCNACVVACMAENNTPVVGKQQVIRQREMHWLRIDRYYEGEPADPRVLFQPVLCQHCETAPCEIVCPVGATTHDSEGLNVMVYNRCVGTRFCSNNCPYKVRRFNYYQFTAEEPRPDVARNPDVTVRARGVMEKCTFCIQRIAAARIDADVNNRPVGADEVKTACQAACPTQAITFGNMAEGGQIVARKQSPLTYALLEDQNTRPRVTYEGRIRNPGQEPGP
jgi:Fe-S-cluster-containing dehydrogenase component